MKTRSSSGQSANKKTIATIAAISMLAFGLTTTGTAYSAPGNQVAASAGVTNVIQLVNGKSRVRVDFPKSLRGKTVTIRISRIVNGVRKFITLGKVTLDKDGKGVLTVKRKLRETDRLIIKDGAKRLYNAKIEVIDDRTIVVPDPTPTPTENPNPRPSPAPIVGTDGPDTLIGGRGDDTIIGGLGADVITGGAGNNLIYGNDSISDDPVAIDTVTYPSEVTISWSSRRGAWRISHSWYTDTLFGIEKIIANGSTTWLADKSSNGGFSTIQTAIDLAATGETVQIGSGAFSEELMVRTPGISVIGSGQEETLIIPARDYATNNRGISIFQSHGSRLAHLTVDGSGNPSLAAGENFQDGIWWEGGGNDITIERVTVRNIDRRAISVFPESVTGTLISHVNVDNVTGARSGPPFYNQGSEGIKMNGAGTVEYSTVSRTLNSINGNVNVTGSHEVNLIGNTVTNIRPARYAGDRFTIGINFWMQSGARINVIDNEISGSVDGGSGIYLVKPGPGSIVKGNNISFTGSRGIGIETGWSANGIEIFENVISMSQKSTGIIATGIGISADRIIIRDNTITNTSAAGLQVNDLRRDGFSSSREVGILLSSEKSTSRTGDAGGAFYGAVRKNQIAGFTNAVVGLKGTLAFDAELTENSIVATGTPLLFGSLSGATFVPAPVSGAIAQWLIPRNWWGSSVVEPSLVASGWVLLSPWCLSASCSTLSPD